MTRYLRGRYGNGLAPPHIWLGVSVEDAKSAVRLKHLRAARASLRSVSFEPLLGPVGEVDLAGIHGPLLAERAVSERVLWQEKWVIEIRDRCQATNVAFFFKQWGGIRPKSGRRLLRGRDCNQYPRTQSRAA
jgi:protein gp37